MNFHRRLLSREFLADTLAMIIFSTIVGMIIELGIAQMSWEKVWHTRLIAVLTNLLTGGLNGVYLNKVRSKFRAEKHRVRQFLADISAFMSFQALVYLINLLIAGASWDQIVKAILSAALICTILGKPYGSFVDLIRKLLGKHHM